MAGIVHEQVQSQGQLHQAHHAGRSLWPHNRRFGVQARAPGHRAQQVAWDGRHIEVERRPPETEHLRPAAPLHHDGHVAQPVTRRQEVEGLVDELDAARRPGQ